jgi:cell wall-associated NlpC family hydrolase
MEAYGHADGIWLPRTTYGMLASPHLVRTYDPQRGDLAFYGTGHVEFVTVWYHTTFGAHDTGSTIGWIGYNPAWGWAPTAFYRVVK